MRLSVKVVDASAIATLVFGESEAAEVVTRLWGAKLVAPALLSFEIASVCLKRLLRHPAQRAWRSNGSWAFQWRTVGPWCSSPASPRADPDSPCATVSATASPATISR